MNDKARDKVASLDFWSSAVEPEPLAGGITNTNFTVNDRGRRFVVRVGDDIPLHGVWCRIYCDPRRRRGDALLREKDGNQEIDNR